MPRWAYDVGELIAAGVAVDPEQERILEEGGRLLTFWPLLQWATPTYPRGAKIEHWLDQNDDPIMVPVMFEAQPWPVDAVKMLADNFGTEYADAAATWPSYFGSYEEEGFLSMYLNMPQDEEVLRLYNGFPLDADDRAFSELQLATDRMLQATGVLDTLAYYMAVEGDEWMPDLIGEEPSTDSYWDPEDHKVNQNLYLELVERGLVDKQGWINVPFTTEPLEKYLQGNTSLVMPWYDLLDGSFLDHRRISKILAQDNHPNYYLEELFCPWV